MTPSTDSEEFIKSSRFNMFKTPTDDKNKKAKKQIEDDDAEVDEAIKPAEQKVLLEKLNSMVELTLEPEPTSPPTPPPPVIAEPVN